MTTPLSENVTDLLHDWNVAKAWLRREITKVNRNDL